MRMIRQAEMTLCAMIICSELPAVTVRSSNATDNASRISEAYSRISNRKTFRGRFMALPLLFLAGLGADRLDGGAALSQHDLALAFALDKDRLLDADGLVLALGPAVGLDSRLIRQLLVKLLKDLLPRDLGRKLADRRIRHLVLRIEERPRRNHAGQRPEQIADAVARQGRDHEGAHEFQ